MFEDEERLQKLLDEVHRIQSSAPRDLLDEIDEETDRAFREETLFDLDEFDVDDDPHYYMED